MDNLATPQNGSFMKWQRVAVQGNPGNYGHMAAQKLCPEAELIFYPTFEEALHAVPTEADGVVLPIENNTMGRVGDIHHLLPKTSLFIVAELYLPIVHCLLANQGASLAMLKTAYSQLPALAQCPQTLKRLGLTPIPTTDTAGAAKEVAARKNLTEAAIASRLAGELYGLNVLIEGVQDYSGNTTRFVALGPECVFPKPKCDAKFSLMFGVKNEPGSLVKALNVFANHHINLTKLESYDDSGQFALTHFYAEGEGNPAEERVKQALETLPQAAAWVKILGHYPRASII